MKVFVSSVMNGFEAERAAARRAIELLRLEPVMAEGFGAKPHSSQTACTTEVRGSDVYLAILGPRYGFVTPAGKSVTEEEFDAARARGLKVLVFASRDAKEPEQEAFLRRVSDYTEGYFRATYTSPGELQDAIVQALNDLVRGRGEGVSEPEAASQLQERMRIVEGRRDDSPRLVAAILPAEGVGEVISPRKLSDPTFQDDLRKLLLFGNSPRLFDARLGTKVEEGESHIEFSQLGEYRDEAKVAAVIFGDASVTTMASLESERKREHYSLADGHVIDRVLLEERIRSSLQFASSFYLLLDDRRLTEFYLWVEIRGVGHRMLGEIPETAVNSMSSPMHNLGPTMAIPTQPRRLSRQQLEDGGDVAADLVERLARTFKAANAYYKPGR